MGQDGEQVTIIVEDSLTESSTLQTGLRNLKLQHLSAATGLILTYFIEVGVQIFLTVYCCRSLVISALNWDWPWFLTISLGVSSLLVSAVSIVWVCRGLDFAGRLCGRLICYVMHFFLLGLVWRYLKLAFAYDHADVQEFVALRIFQAYIQSLPLTSIHLAWLITFRENWTSLTLWLVAIEAIAIAAGLIIASYIKAVPQPDDTPQLPHHHTTQMFLDNLKCSTKGLDEEESVMWCRVLSIELNLVSRALLLSARLIVIGILLVHLQYWTPLIILAHFLLSFTWITLSEKNYTGFIDLLTRGLQISYVLFWDVTCTLVGRLNLWTWALPALLVTVENGALVLLHWYRVPGELLVTITSGTCLLFGTLLFVALNLLSLTPLHELFGIETRKRTDIECAKPLPELFPAVVEMESPGSSTLSQIPQLIKDSSSWGLTGISSQKSNPSIIPNNYTGISEGLMMTLGRMSGDKGRRTTLDHTLPPARPGAPTPTTTWVPDTCCNDSNGSSNSRNTNTLLEPGTLPDNEPEVDNLVGTHFVFCYPTQARTHQHPPDPIRRKSPHEPSQSQSLTRTRPSKSHRLSPTVSVNVRLRTSSPVEIKSASRVIMNHPKHGKARESPSRCPCHRPQQWRKQDLLSDSIVHPVSHPDPHERLLEDSYGILICEGETPSRPKGSSAAFQSIFHVNKKLRVLCAKCFQNHDPLLTDCLEEADLVEMPPGPPRLPLPSETTDYPSGTEMTADDQLSVSSHHSTATYTTWPHNHHQAHAHWSHHNQAQPRTHAQTSMMPPSGTLREFPKEFTSREYVRTWLLTSQARIRQYHQYYDVSGTTKDKSVGRLKKVHRSRTIQTLPPQPRREVVTKNPNSRTCREARRHKRPLGILKRGLGDGDVVPETCIAEVRESQSDDEGLARSPSFPVQGPSLPYPTKSTSLSSGSCAPLDQTFYENGLTQETLQMFYKDLEIIV